MNRKNNKEAVEQPTKQELSDQHGYEYHKSGFREVVEVLLYGLALLMFFRVFVFQNFQIPTSSMENNLLIGDHITANMFVFKNSGTLDRALLPFRDVKRGDVIVFKYPGNEREDWIKRCIGVPGDSFQIIQDEVFINNKSLEETYQFYKPHRGRDDRDKENSYYPLGFETDKPGLINNPNTRPGQVVTLSSVLERTKNTLQERYVGQRDMSKEDYERVMSRLEAGDGQTIPDGFYLMMGDNRNFSHDSRAWGLVPEELVQGRAWLIWWSYGEEVDSHLKKGGEKIMSYIKVPITFWTRTHWSRCFDLIK